MGKPNRVSVTYSVRVEHWLDDEIKKLMVRGETRSDFTRRALLAYITKDENDDD